MFNSKMMEQRFELTKRNFLKKIATLFDPLGFLSPSIIRAKMLMQEVWVQGVDWDEELPLDTSTQVTTWFRELSSLPSVRIPRCLQLRKEVSSIAVHVFVDASLEAYGAVVYVRVKYQDGSLSVHLVSSKTKVAPLQSVSVPRLELMGAVLGSRLATSISDALDMEKQSYTFWTDSANVLWWIRGYSRTFKSFVANRVGEIHSSSSPDQWRYVPTKLNPADYLTRGVKLMELVELRMWWEGPEYLKEDESQWPRNVVYKRHASAVEEVKQKYTVKEPSEEKSAFMTTTTKIIWRLQPERFSSWNKLTRLQAWVMRFTKNCRSHQHERLLDKGINLEEIWDAEKLILKTTQKECFKEEYTAIVERKKLPKNSKLLSLCP